MVDFKNYSKTFLHFHTDEIPSLLLKYIQKKDMNLIDLGAGDGALLVGLRLGNFLTNSSKITAVDISEDRCNRLKDLNFDTICSDVTSLPMIKDNSYDFIICTQVIEHVDEKKLLDEIKRILNKDGSMYIASIVKKSYGWWYYKDKKGNWAMDPTHLREYASKEHFESILKSHGFNVKESKLSHLKLSILEFIMRRIIAPIFKNKNLNSIFMKSKILNMLRKKINVYPPGYYIIESIVDLKNEKVQT